METWKLIPNTDEYYISNLGRIKNKHQRILKCKNHNGYKKIGIRVNGTQRFFFIHRLVMNAFNPIENINLCVDHINRLRFDNRLENLRWTSIKENNANRVFTSNLESYKVYKHLLDKFGEDMLIKKLKEL